MKALHLAGRVTLAGYAELRRRRPDRLRGGDVFVSPTYSEGFSNTILEAMASGLPVVSTQAVGVIDCLTDEENGLLVPVGAVDELAAALVRVSGRPRTYGCRLADPGAGGRAAVVLLGSGRPADSWGCTRT